MAEFEHTGIATRSNVGLDKADMPDFLKNQATPPRGLEEATAKDMLMPRVAICQSGTEQRKKSSPSFIDGLAEGQLFNTLTGRNYGDSLSFIPLFFYKSRILFTPLEQGGGIRCQAPDGKACQLNHGGPCLHQDWGADGTPPECTEFYNFPALIVDDKNNRDLAVLSFKSTGISAAKQLNSHIRFSNADTFAGTYEFTTAPDKNQAGQEYYVPVIKPIGWVRDSELYRFAEETYNQLREKAARQELHVDSSGLNDSDAAFADRDSAEM